MTKYLLGIAAVLSMALLATFWRLDHVSGRLDHVSGRLEVSSQRVRDLEASISSRKVTQRLLAQLDTQHTQERERENQTNADLRAAVAAGERRLSVLAKCPAVRASSATASLDHAEARAELDPAAAERIVRIANDGDDAIRQLSALQDYVRTACSAPK